MAERFGNSANTGDVRLRNTLNPPPDNKKVTVVVEEPINLVPEDEDVVKAGKRSMIERHVNECGSGRSLIMTTPKS